MKLVKIDGASGLVDSGGLKKNVNIAFIKSAKIGDYLLIHAGFAIEKVKTDEARKTLKAIRDIEDEIR